MADSKDFQVGKVRNPAGALSPDNQTAAQRLRDQALASLRQYEAALSSDPVAAARREVQRETARVWASIIPDFDARAKSIRKLPGQTIDKETVLRRPSWWDDFRAPAPPPPPPPAPRAGVGEFWWAETNWSSSIPGITIDFPASDLRIFGHAHYKQDPLLAAHAGLIASFELSPDRFPPTAASVFRSAPHVLLTGIVSGWTGYYHPIWAADDKWCKCWLIRRQIVFQPRWIGAALVPVPLAFAEAVDEQFNLENVVVHGQANKPMPGFLAMPPVTFNLTDRSQSLLVLLTVRFDVQMEGDAEIWFRQRGGSASESVPGPDNAVLVQHPQWNIQPL